MRLGTFVQLSPRPDEDAELLAMSDGDGGIFLAVNKEEKDDFYTSPDVMLHLTRKQTIQLEILLHDASGFEAKEKP